MDGSGDGEDVARPKKANVWRSILISFAAAAVFAGILGSYLVKATRIPNAPLLVATNDAAPQRPNAVDVAQRAASAFVASLRAGDYEGAYAQMARPYRESASLASFRKAWRTPLLASPQAIKLSNAQERSVQIDGKFIRGATFTSTGMLIAAAGALEVSLTFLRENGEAHVLAVFVGGVPVIQGLGPSTAPTP